MSENMDRKSLYMPLIVLVLFGVALPQTAYATCSQSFYFSSDGLQFSFHRNYGGEKRGLRFINDIKPLLPSILAIDEDVRARNQSAELSIGCQQYGRAYLHVSGVEARETECENEGATGIIDMVASQLKITIKPKAVLDGYTLQIAYAKGYNTSSNEMLRWERIITRKEYTSSLRIDGDCVQTPIWIHQYPDGSYGIRFGVYNTFRDAWKAISVLNLGAKHSQILPLRMRIDDLEDYLRSDSDE